MSIILDQRGENMNYLSGIVLFFLAFSTFAKEVNVKRVGNNIRVSFDLSKVSVKHKMIRGTTFKKIETKTLSTISIPGAPDLPLFGMLLEGKPRDFLVKTSKGEARKINNFLPLPCPKKLRCSSGGASYKRSQKYYRGDFPKKLIKIDYLGDFRGKHYSKLSIVPAKSLGSNSLILYSNLKVEVSKKSRSRVRALKTSASILRKNRSSGVDNRLLVVTPKAFKAAMKPFVVWKRKLGFSVKVVTLESIGNDSAKLKKYFRSMLKKRETSFGYVVLVGDENVFATEYVSTGSSSRTPSDLKYFTKSEEDFIPEAFYSRFVVENPEQIKIQTEKIINYEKAHFENLKGFSRSIGIASNEGNSPSDEEYIQMIGADMEENLNVKQANLFESELGGEISLEVDKLLGIGGMWITYLGHGDGYSWPNGGGFNIRDIENLTNTDVQPVIIDVACQNGRYKQGHFGTTWVNATGNGGQPIGAVAYYGGSVNVAWHPPATMALGVERRRAANKLTRVGDIVIGGQLYLFEKSGNVSSSRDNIAQYHLFGDPTMVVRNTIPKKVKLRREGNKVVVSKVSRGRTSPLSGVTVVFHDNKENFVKVMTNSQGEAKIPSGQRSSVSHASFHRQGMVYSEIKL